MFAAILNYKVVNYKPFLRWDYFCLWITYVNSVAVVCKTKKLVGLVHAVKLHPSCVPSWYPIGHEYQSHHTFKTCKVSIKSELLY